MKRKPDDIAMVVGVDAVVDKLIDNNISMRDHLQRQIDTEIAHVLLFFNERINALERMQASLTLTSDQRHDQRFAAQEKAVDLALARVDKEFHEHLRSVQEETKMALGASDKAITKSEVSVEKRFESQNAFREQLNSQAALFLPRKEADVRMDAISERVDAIAERITALQLRVTSRLDIGESRSEGGREAIMDKRTANGALIAFVGLGITVVLAVITIVGFVIANVRNP